MTEALTPRQQTVLDYIRECIRLDGRPPTMREAARHFGWRNHSAIVCHLEALERKGAIRWDRGATRGILVVDDADNQEDGIPLLAKVPAGPFAEAVADSDERVPIARSSFARPMEIFALRVKGRSMTGAGIQDGDIVIVRKTVEAAAGQVVVARVDNEVTLKRFMREGGKVYLKAENPESEDIHFTPEQEVVIEGIVLGLYRLFGK